MISFQPMYFLSDSFLISCKEHNVISDDEEDIWRL